ncbi:unnamed protein product, partial [Prorocentrum cordatum]
REVTFGDLKTAFMQSDKDHSDRPRGKLYASLPPGGSSLEDGTWVEAGSLIQLNTAVCGLVNAPAAWRKTLVRAIEDLGCRRSCYDPCVFCLMTPKGPYGHLLIEVDDVAAHGNSVHDEKMRCLQQRFRFGKWKTIYCGEGDYAGRTMQQHRDYGFHIHQGKFVVERLSPITIPKGRKSNKNDPTDGEQSQLRASQGAFLVGAATPALWDYEAAPVALVSYKSHRLLVAGRTADPNKELQRLMTICDAKSLCDHLNSESAGCAADRRTAIEMQIIRSSLDAQNGTVRWVDHSGMYADAMTKRSGNLPLLQIMMRTGRLCITEETSTLEKHRLDPNTRNSQSKTRSDPAQSSG